MILSFNQIQKEDSSYPRAIRDLRRFLNREEPRLVRFIGRFWGEQQNAITYAEIRQAILAGGIDATTLEAWRQDYSHLITSELVPAWNRAMDAAAQTLRDKYPDYIYDPNTKHIRAWTANHAAELIVDITGQQRTAINSLVQRAATLQDMSVDELSRVIRPTIGLYPGQAVANLNYYKTVKQRLMDVNSHIKPETAAKKANEAAVKYSAKQLRYRAQMIARTELAFAYNVGENLSVRQAIDDGLMGKTKKRSLSAGDDRVCDACKDVDEETVDMDENFSNGHDKPPYHPHCRCVLVYKEQEPPII